MTSKDSMSVMDGIKNRHRVVEVATDKLAAAYKQGYLAHLDRGDLQIIEESDRLRAALWHIAQDEFSEAYEHCEDGQNDYWRVVNIARECSSGETGPNS